MNVQVARTISPALLALMVMAEKGLRAHRGGTQLLATMRGDRTTDEYLDHLIDERALWILENDGVVQGFAIYRGELIEALYVVPSARRGGCAKLMLRTLLALENPPKDAYALPGDRGTKSIYESIGWKARLLTMRGD
jgi:GNAT superfamily N-acetyltransferase